MFQCKAPPRHQETRRMRTRVVKSKGGRILFREPLCTAGLGDPQLAAMAPPAELFDAASDEIRSAQTSAKHRSANSLRPGARQTCPGEGTRKH